jgi:hypothetical protein
MGLTLRFGTSRWQFCIISIVLTAYKFNFNLLELDIVSKEEPISLLTIIKNSTYTRIEFFKYSKTIKNK